MSFHRNAKLGLAGRYALVCAIAEGMTLKAAAAAFSVSPATAHRWWHRWLEAGEEARATLSCLFDRSSRPHRSPAAARAGARRGDLRLPAQDRLGAAPGRRRDRLLPLDRLEGAQAGRDLAAAAACAGAGQPLRVALPRRPAAHGHQRVRPLRTARPPRHRRPLEPGPPAPRRRRLRARDRRRPLPARLRRDPRRRESRDRRRLPRARARLLRRARDHAASG